MRTGIDEGHASGRGSLILSIMIASRVSPTTLLCGEMWSPRTSEIGVRDTTEILDTMGVFQLSWFATKNFTPLLKDKPDASPPSS